MPVEKPMLLASLKLICSGVDRHIKSDSFIYEKYKFELDLLNQRINGSRSDTDLYPIVTDLTHLVDKIDRAANSVDKKYLSIYVECIKKLYRSENQEQAAKILYGDLKVFEESDEVTSVTYNIQQLIGSAKRNVRAKKLLRFFESEAINADVIVLEEAFQTGFLRKLEKSFLARDYHIIKPKGCELINSGVCLLLKKATFGAFENLQVIQKDYLSTTTTSWDKLVPKGFTHVAVFHAGKKIHIIGTHPSTVSTLANRRNLSTACPFRSVHF